MSTATSSPAGRVDPTDRSVVEPTDRSVVEPTDRSVVEPTDRSAVAPAGPGGGRMSNVEGYLARARHLVGQHLGIVILLGLGAVLRLLFMIAYRPAFWFHGDSGRYVEMATGSLEPDATRPVGYPALLRLLEPTGTHLAVVAVQHLLSRWTTCASWRRRARPISYRGCISAR